MLRTGPMTREDRCPASGQREESRWRSGGAPLDTWLRQGLGTAYASVLDEPIPETLRMLARQAGET